MSQYCNLNEYQKENLGIILEEIDSNTVLVSSIERTLIELIVRPGYSKNFKLIRKIYSDAKP